MPVEHGKEFTDHSDLQYHIDPDIHLLQLWSVVEKLITQYTLHYTEPEILAYISVNIQRAESCLK